MKNDLVNRTKSINLYLVLFNDDDDEDDESWIR